MFDTTPDSPCGCALVKGSATKTKPSRAKSHQLRKLQKKLPLQSPTGKYKTFHILQKE